MHHREWEGRAVWKKCRLRVYVREEVETIIDVGLVADWRICVVITGFEPQPKILKCYSKKIDCQRESAPRARRVSKYSFCTELSEV